MAEQETDRKMSDREMLFVAYGAMKAAGLNQPLIRMLETHLELGDNVPRAPSAASIDLSSFRG